MTKLILFLIALPKKGGAILAPPFLRYSNKTIVLVSSPCLYTPHQHFGFVPNRIQN
jgi:hypothetical protein